MWWRDGQIGHRCYVDLMHCMCEIKSNKCNSYIKIICFYTLSKRKKKIQNSWQNMVQDGSDSDWICWNDEANHGEDYHRFESLRCPCVWSPLDQIQVPILPWFPRNLESLISISNRRFRSDHTPYKFLINFCSLHN